MRFVHSLTPRPTPSSTSCVPRLPIQTWNSKHNSEQGSTSTPPIKVDDDFEYEISEILDSKIDKWQKCILLYLVRWTGYDGTDQETDRLSTTELEHAAELVQDFHKSYPDKPGPLTSLRCTPEQGMIKIILFTNN